ncbi:MAG: YbaB/EbfC family nucleoid-associated protein [Candidatus Magasanikbacteria bacterium]
MSLLNKLKQFKDLREQGKKIQGVMSKESVTVRAAGDSVVLTMDGNMSITGLSIADDLLNPTKKEKLQTAIKDAHADAIKKIQRVMASKMQEMGGLEGLGLPGMK